MKSSARLAATIPLTYLLLSILWILLSDTLLASIISDPAILTRMQIFKGWFFVSSSALLIYYLLQRNLKAVLKNEIRFRDLFRVNPQPMWVYDLETLAFLEVNDAAVSRYGYSPKEFLAMRITDIRPAEDVQDLLVDMALPRSEVMFSGPWRHRLKDGTIIYVEITSHTITYTNRPAALVIAQDITERRRTEIANSRLVSILGSTPDLVAMTSLSGEMLYLNPAGRSLLGIEPTELIQSFNITDFHPPDSVDYLCQTAFRTAAESGFWQGELSFRSRNGRIFPASQVVLYHPQSGEEPAFYSTVARDITEARQSRTEILRQLQRLEALRIATAAITNNLDLPVTLEVILDQATTQLQLDAAAVLLYNAISQSLDYAAGRGFITSKIQEARVYLGTGSAGTAAQERRTIFIADLRYDTSDPERNPAYREEGFVTYYGIPLVAKGRLLGVLELFHRAQFDPDPGWHEFMRTLARQAAIALDNANLFTEMQRYNQELTQAYEATIYGWSRAMDLRDSDTEGHTQRVAELTVQLAHSMGVKETGLVHIRHGALLHDIGKMGVPDAILNKPGPLTPEEQEIMQRHPVYAYEMLSEISYLKPALDIPYCHHEHWDGSGYPHGLKKEQIPLAARIFAVVDVWDAITHDRPYRPRWSHQRAWEYLLEKSDHQFDPQIVQAFGRMLFADMSESK